MLKVFYPEVLEVGSIIHLNGEEARHLFRVLRANNGEKIIIINGKGHCAEGHILDLKTQSIGIDQVHFKGHNQITLYPALLKNKAMDCLIHEATAIGVAQIIPLIAEHSEVKINTETAFRKQFHWNLIAKEACKQSGNPTMPHIEVPQNIEQIDFHRPTFVAALQGARANIFSHQNIIKTGAINLIVGPEGDFSEREYQYFAQKNFHFIHLSKNILRSEIAALYFLSVVDHLMGG